jgi:hypothetical protein
VVVTAQKISNLLTLIVFLVRSWYTTYALTMHGKTCLIAVLIANQARTADMVVLV